ncbi:ABC transporter substrate-binding protein [Streptomyces sp. NPDC001492]
MRTFTRTSRTLFAPFALITSATVLLTACGSGAGGSTDGAGTSAKADKIPTTDVVSGVHKDEASAKLLPSGTRSLTVAFSVGGTPPGTTYLDDGKTLTGQGFAARKDSKLSKVTDLRQLCGLNVATGAGTTFEATLEENKKLCTTAGKKPYKVQTYNETGAIWSSLQQGRSDVVMSTINGLRYAVAQQQGVKFLNEYHRLDVGFAFKKGTKLAPAFQSAVNKLIADGTYEKILKKWGTTGSAITKSQISPPELKN